MVDERAYQIFGDLMIAHETEVVATRYDEAARVCHYTIQRDGKRWTASLPFDELEKHKGNKAARRAMVANALETAMRGPPDAIEEPVSTVEAEAGTDVT